MYKVLTSRINIIISGTKIHAGMPQAHPTMPLASVQLWSPVFGVVASTSSQGPLPSLLPKHRINVYVVPLTNPLMITLVELWTVLSFVECLFSDLFVMMTSFCLYCIEVYKIVPTLELNCGIYRATIISSVTFQPLLRTYVQHVHYTCVCTQIQYVKIIHVRTCTHGHTK